MTYRFFENVNSVDELKRQYKKLVFQHHPDTIVYPFDEKRIYPKQRIEQKITYKRY